MSITLDGIELNKSMVWTERYTSKSVAQSVRRTLGGRPIVFSGPLTKGENITLEATEGYGWLTRTTVEALLQRASVAGAIYVLSFNAVNYNVVFRHDEAPAVEMVPLIPRTNDGADDRMIGVIRLMTV